MALFPVPVRTPETPAPAEDGTLVQLAQAGESVALESLAEKARRTAYLIALQLLGNREDAMDVAQDAMVRILGSLRKFDAARPLRPWVATIVNNLVRDRWRRRRVRRTDSLEEYVATSRLELADSGDGPETLAEAREIACRVARAVRGLPPASREILILRDYQDLSYAEIAAILVIPIGTVMSRLHRARLLLREALGGRERGRG